MFQKGLRRQQEAIVRTHGPEEASEWVSLQRKVQPLESGSASIGQLLPFPHRPPDPISGTKELWWYLLTCVKSLWGPGSVPVPLYNLVCAPAL